jgi:hypothetical protein
MDKMINIQAEIKEIKYKPFLCRNLNTFDLKDFGKALSSEATFLLNVDKKNKLAISWWVSAKRTRSYPYARVYNSLSFSGKKVTIIPIFKDEGKEGDRDFLQWDTISLMSLLGVYVIVAYYAKAIPSSKYNKKITEQRFDLNYLLNQIKKLLSYQSDALHWNLSQIDNIGEVGKNAISSYKNISQRLGIEMHSKELAEKRIEELEKGKDSFISLSRKLAQLAQKRESITIQPKERLDGTKGTITIKNYLGGNYYFTSDEINIKGNNLFLIEGKHSENKNLPSVGDIKDGLLRMILFSNLVEVKINNKKFNSKPILKLTTKSVPKITPSEKEMLSLLKKEAEINRFKVMINNSYL